ncbi:hypothetical protein SAMN04488128_101932 [Chitinophaga eiseniae]|uniref:Uncharacterized protein n=1 Tax=Chitinophaga eiseniae TaxID=634771 RepID=A0A1T4M477_9BACT|nr:hypothetical protein SAMN04488128_101932 [Chitinophaga eiseniae]
MQKYPVKNEIIFDIRKNYTSFFFRIANKAVNTRKKKSVSEHFCLYCPAPEII